MAAELPKHPSGPCGCPIIEEGCPLHFVSCDQHEVTDCLICEHELPAIQERRRIREAVEAKIEALDNGYAGEDEWHKIYAFREVLALLDQSPPASTSVSIKPIPQ